MKTSLLLLVAVSMVCVAAQAERSGPIKTCSQISLARPGFGASYRGVVQNDDYKLSLTIPDSLTGWGADPVAPFHGFTIFLPGDDRRACIMFEIHLRVDLGRQKAGPRGTKVMLGDVTAWREEASGVINGADLTNVTIRFSVTHGQEVDDGTVRLVSPTKDIGRNRPTFEGFLSQIRFNHQ